MGKKQKQVKKQLETPEHFQVFVTGLPYETTEDELKNFFDFATQPVIKLPKYQDTGRCLGYGHVQFSSKQEYEKALQKDAQYIGPRFVLVRPAKGKKQVEPQEKKNIPVGCKVLFVKNLPYTITKQELRNQFTSCGIVKQVRMIRNWQNKNFKGFAYIDFRDNGSVKKAIGKYHGKEFKGRKLVCDAVTTGMKKGFKKEHENQDEENDNNEQEEMQYEDNGEENDQNDDSNDDQENDE